ncbi:hypothetical protein P43SY_002117 [Pythium insidiosum]|uniref:Uncharacterized protein n=1 Tax=Pythium insidiosum TaxID=114742 RepID=A0AAD5MHM8_PYTIN|nr:hypothetical protein P43SY_002117 [Pythium insidiosum]
MSGDATQDFASVGMESADEEMKDVAVGAASDAGEERASTWNFVQMNMTLLPIARPLPVSISNRVYDGVIGRKPRTPNQKLHHRVLHNASNISPRRNDAGLLARRATLAARATTSEPPLGVDTPPSGSVSAPIDIPARRGKRKSEFDLPSSSSASSSWQMAHSLQDQEMTRWRSLSEDLLSQDLTMSWGDAIASTSEGFQLSRSVSTSSGLAQRAALFKGKRILEIQDEERRLYPDESVSLPSPSKRSRHS